MTIFKVKSNVFNEKIGEIFYKLSKNYSLLFLDEQLLFNESAFAEVPLLFENGYEKDFDGIIVVLRNIEDRIASLELRDGTEKEEILKKMAAQFDYQNNLKYLKERSNIYLITNNGTVGDLEFEIEKIVKT